MSLIERSVRTLLAAGLERVVVVVGHHGDQLASEVKGSFGSRVEIVRSSRWEDGDGASLMAAEDEVAAEGLFVVAQANVVFSSGALERIVRTRMPATLVAPAPGSEEARVEGSPVDCGVYVVGPDIFRCLRHGAEGDHTLAGAIARYTADRTVKALPLDLGAGWQDVKTPGDLGPAREMLRRSLTKEIDGPVAAYLHRPISTRVTMALAPLRLSPNLITLAALLAGVWGGWSLSAGRTVVGGLLIQLCSVLDGMDGETARLLVRTSRAGAILDGVTDRMVDAALITGIILWVWVDPSRTFRAVSIATASVVWGGVALLTREAYRTFEVAPRDLPVVLLIGGRDSRLLVASVFTILGLPQVGLAGGAGLYFVSVGVRILLKRRALPPAAPAKPDQIGEAADGDLHVIGEEPVDQDPGHHLRASAT